MLESAVLKQRGLRMGRRVLANVADVTKKHFSTSSMLLALLSSGGPVACIDVCPACALDFATVGGSSTSLAATWLTRPTLIEVINDSAIPGSPTICEMLLKEPCTNP